MSVKRKSRYYASPYNESLKIKNTFVVPETQEWVNALYSSCDKYCETKVESVVNIYKRALGLFILRLNYGFDIAGADGPCLERFCTEISSQNRSAAPFIKSLLYHALELNTKYGWHPELCVVAERTFPFWSDIQNVGCLVIPLLNGTKRAERCRVFKCESPAKKSNTTLSLLEFDTDDAFTQDLLTEFLYSQHTTFPGVYYLEFFKRFGESLDYDLPSDIYGFNAETLLQQEQFFVTIRREAELECRYFYRFILAKQGNRPSITLSDGISLRYLMNENFVTRYSAGYRYVPINPNEPVPFFDKWALSPNGLEQKVASDKPEHIRYLDFTRISNPVIKTALKTWFWSEAKNGFENRCRSAIYVMEFFEYRDNLRSMYFDKFVQARAGTDLDIKNTVLAEEIISYTNHWDKILTYESYKTRIVSLRLFLQYMNDKNVYKTEAAAFEYMFTSGRGSKPPQEILSIPRDEFVKLIAMLEERAKSNTLCMLYYVVFCLNTLTPLRISSILDLKFDCIVEKSKGIYAIETKVKTSNGDKRSIQISQQVYRLINVALSLTAETRANAPAQQREFLFLVNNQRGFYHSISVSSYTVYLQRCCKAVGLKNYSAQNLRKTYYTNLIENAIKNNVSLMSLKELTGHSNIDTTENYYVKENIRNYLEATYGVEIGTMPIAGSVTSEYPDARNEDLVNDSCGYCRNPECNVLGTANCLMCRGFVTTPAHIPQFEEALNILSKQIVDNGHEHDKEHLYAVKRLYVAYLERLYMKKEETEDAAGIKN